MGASCSFRAVGLTALVACSAPAAQTPIAGHAETVDPIARVQANDCPANTLGPWSVELFPACPPLQYGRDMPLCLGSRCGQPCGAVFGGSHGDYTSTFAYDDRGRFLAQTYNGKVELNCTYAGERLASCTLGGDTMRVERDALGRVISIGDGTDREKRITYDGNGRMIALGDRVFVYDVRGWLVKDGEDEVEHDAAGHVFRIGTGPGAIAYEYAGDRLVKSVGPNETNATFQYDGQGRLVRVGSGGLERHGETLYSYDCK